MAASLPLLLKVKITFFTYCVNQPRLVFLLRIALTGAHSGQEFDKLLPLIEDGAELSKRFGRLGVPSVRERIERFVGV
jgi:hypothetical protein